ncbi:natriuretic peptides A [Periophthalmus magnuspinnatus]|uniref:natriuretic peptides A n=1 Tax=Periophthalmus magnuspinnatus TaxID=409849 RepID=UPI00145B36FD|nr:natriuretic peptides A [Periophthalmus magnuspinnatus]
MRAAFVWGLLLPLLCQLYPGAQAHSLARAATTDLDQLKSVLQRLEASLSVVPDEEQEPGDYAPEPGSPQGVGSRGTESDVPSQRSQLLDLLLSARRSSSGCFGARMDRIGNASGLGCGRG